MMYLAHSIVVELRRYDTNYATYYVLNKKRNADDKNVKVSSHTRMTLHSMIEMFVQKQVTKKHGL